MEKLSYKEFSLRGLIAGGIAIVTMFVSNVLTHTVEKPLIGKLENLQKKD